MKKHLRWIALVLMTAPVAALAADTRAAAAPRWTPIGPPAGPVSALLVLDPVLGDQAFALTAAGLQRSQNGGRLWGSLQSGLDGQPLALAVDPSRPGRLYASTASLNYQGSISRSDDFGGHWTVLYRPPHVDLSHVQHLAVDPFSPETLYWNQNARLYRSQNGGRSWTCLPLGVFCASTVATPVTDFALSPVREGTVYAQSDGAFFTSLDGGATWSRSVLSPNPPALTGSAKSLLQGESRIFPTSTPHQLYVQAGYVSSYCFLRSDDDGATWHGYLGQGLCGNPAVDPVDPETVRLAVSTDDGAQLWVSHAGGEDGRFVGALPALGNLYQFAAGDFLLATDQGLFRAESAAGPWLPANRGFSASEISTVFATEDRLFAAPVVQVNYYGPPPAMPTWSSADGGRSWVSAPLANAAAFAVDPRDPRHLIASTYRIDASYMFFYRVLESHDDGQSWTGVAAPQPIFFQTLAIDPFDARTFYGGTADRGFYRSRDGGHTWQRANAGLPVSTYCNEHFCEPNDVTAILADPEVPGRLSLVFRSRTYVSEDGGAHWTFRGPIVSFLTRGPGNTLLALAYPLRPADQARLGVIYRSIDGGRTWTQAGRLPGRPAAASAIQFTGFVVTGRGLFASTNLVGVFWSRDGGKSWSALNAGLPTPAVDGLAADPSDPGKVYAIVPQNGVYAIEVP